MAGGRREGQKRKSGGYLNGTCQHQQQHQLQPSTGAQITRGFIVGRDAAELRAEGHKYPGHQAVSRARSHGRQQPSHLLFFC